MRGRDFKPEFNRHCCELVLNDNLKVSEVCKRFDFDRQTLHCWLSEFIEFVSEAFTGSMITKEALIKSQQRRLKKQAEAIEILKKAIAYCKQKNDG